MTVIMQNKIAKEEFIRNHWNNLLEAIHIEKEEYYKKYRKDFIIFLSLVLFLFCSTIFTMYLGDVLTISNIIFATSTCGFFDCLFGYGRFSILQKVAKKSNIKRKRIASTQF